MLYWRDKDRHEIDFIIPGARGSAMAIECKWNASGFDPRNLKKFCETHPTGKNLVVAVNVSEPYTPEVASLTVTFTGIDGLKF